MHETLTMKDSALLRNHIHIQHHWATRYLLSQDPGGAKWSVPSESTRSTSAGWPSSTEHERRCSPRIPVVENRRLGIASAGGGGLQGLRNKEGDQKLLQTRQKETIQLAIIIKNGKRESKHKPGPC